MIIIEFYDGQGLGNQLWVYVVMRALAKKLNMPFIVLSHERFKAKYFLDIDYGKIEEAKEVLEKIEENKISYFKELMYLDMDLDCFMVDYDSSILNIKPYTKIDGYFQSEKYFFDGKEFFKSFIAIKSNLLNENFVAKGTCVLNIRGGEENKNNINLILPKSYWNNAMDYMKQKFNIENFAIVTDDQEYCKELFPDIKIIKSGIAESYTALHQASYLIVSNSSFSYFPIKTKKEKPFVIAPMYWSRFDNKFKRWSSPANLYQDWTWLDGDGNLFTYDECLCRYKENINYYNTTYNVRVQDNITESFNLFSIKKYIPKSFKDTLKKVLPYNFVKEISRNFK